MVRSAYARCVSALLVLVVAILTTLFVEAMQPAGQSATVRLVPDVLRDTSWVDQVGAAQIKAIAGSGVFHDFQFTDRLVNSRITFTHRIVDDAGKTYKAAHYDHGNGIAIADVDGDGLSDVYFV